MALEQVERDESVRIVYACETGSRAWGFESADSDYDVRFLYVRPMESYLSIVARRDVIELPTADNLDINGWDIRKALFLMRKSNPPLLEWLQSPLVYQEIPSVAAGLRSLAVGFYSPRACSHHYLNMAQGNYRAYLQGEEVWYKKYFYVLRPVLACLWIERNIGPVPIEFQKLVDAVVEERKLRDAIDDLVVQKKRGFEADRGPKILAISMFIEQELPRLESIRGQYPSAMGDPGHLDRFFRETLGVVWNRPVSVTGRGAGLRR